MISPLSNLPLFHLGPLPVPESVVATWGIMLLLAGGGAMLTRRLQLVPSRTQAALELIVSTVDSQIR
ncbi:MAG: F0F1 ATP synthase subunit A, partial [Acidocella sp.]|nr:F0F1 ATP synthase subunit A [Acidocella sp.]